MLHHFFLALSALSTLRWQLQPSHHPPLVGSTRSRHLPEAKRLCFLPSILQHQQPKVHVAIALRNVNFIRRRFLDLGDLSSKTRTHYLQRCPYRCKSEEDRKYILDIMLSIEHLQSFKISTQQNRARSNSQHGEPLRGGCLAKPDDIQKGTNHHTHQAKLKKHHRNLKPYPNPKKPPAINKNNPPFCSFQSNKKSNKSPEKQKPPNISPGLEAKSPDPPGSRWVPHLRSARPRGFSVGELVKRCR